MNVSLSGKNVFNEINLSGKSMYSKKNIPLEIKNLKIKIFNEYLIPLFSKNWDVLDESVFFIQKIKKKIHSFYQSYKLEDLLFYIDFLKLIEIIIEKQKLLENAENQLYRSSSLESKEKVVSMVFKTSMIKLLPEYELYHVIIGKPKRELKEKYNEVIIHDLKKLLELESMNFNKIKDLILEKYKTI